MSDRDLEIPDDETECQRLEHTLSLVTQILNLLTLNIVEPRQAAEATLATVLERHPDMSRYLEPDDGGDA